MFNPVRAESCGEPRVVNLFARNLMRGDELQPAFENFRGVGQKHEARKQLLDFASGTFAVPPETVDGTRACGSTPELVENLRDENRFISLNRRSPDPSPDQIMFRGISVGKP